MQTAVAAALSSVPSQTVSSTRPTYLMCPPQWYDVDYVINPWMAGNLHRPSRDLAFTQWRTLYETLHRLADIRVLPAEPGSPDMVFIAHTAAVRHGVAAISSFAHIQRQAEEQHLRRWLQSEGFLVWDTPRETTFEGEGDALFDAHHGVLWAAHGPRTSEAAHRHLSRAWLSPVRSLHLTDPRFYHLDTCFAPLHGGHVLYFPDAFDHASRTRIEQVYAPEHRIAVTEGEATRFACNVLNLADTIVTGHSSLRLARRLADAGYDLTRVDLSEFLHGGGSAKSMALHLGDGPTPTAA